MSTNEKKGITVKIDAELHAQVREYLEDDGRVCYTGVTGRATP